MSPLAPTLQLFFTERLIQAASGEPGHDHLLSPHLRTAPAFRAEPHRQGALGAGLGRPRCRGDLDVPGAPGDRAAQQRAQPQHLAGRAALTVPPPPRCATLSMLSSSRRCSRFPEALSTRPPCRSCSPPEVDALLAAPDRHRWEGRRDHALIALAVQTGLRLSELTGLTCGDIQLDAHAHVRCQGKGRKQRCVPLTAGNVAILRVWRKERGGHRDDPLSRPAPVGTSAQTPWKPASLCTRPRPLSAVLRCGHKKLTPIPSGTPAQ